MSLLDVDNKIVITTILLIRILINILFLIILIIPLCLMDMWFKTGKEAFGEIFSLATIILFIIVVLKTLLESISMAVKLKKWTRLTGCDMLIELNSYFHNSDCLMKVYKILKCHETDSDVCVELWKNVRNVEVAHYCTFLEKLYLLYRADIVTIEDLDDMFGYRFFVFANNPYIQANYILPTSSLYIQIFKLYEVWTTYRRKVGGSNWMDTIPYVRFMFSEKCLKEIITLGLKQIDFIEYERVKHDIFEYRVKADNIRFDLRGNIKHDPLEDTPKYKAIEKLVELEIKLRLIGKHRGLGFCYKYWAVKHAVLARYGIEWHSPAEMNPYVMFD